MPDCAAAGTSPQMLMSCCRSLKGDVWNKVATSLRASRSNLATLGRRVAVAEDQQIQLRRRVAALVKLDHRAGRSRGVAQHELVCRIDRHGPYVAEHVLRVALLDHDPGWR